MLFGVSSVKFVLSLFRLMVVYKLNVIGLCVIVEVVENMGFNVLVVDNDDNNV